MTDTAVPTLPPKMYSIIAGLLGREMARIEDQLEAEHNEDVRADLEMDYSYLKLTVDWLDRVSATAAPVKSGP